MGKKFNISDFLPEAGSVSESDQPEALREIPLPKIIANGRNLYGVRDVESLAESIKVSGLLEPLIVYPYGGAAELYRLISGHRRLAALQLNKAESALCRIVDKPASAAREDLLIISANAQRVKTGAEQALEAERMTAALVALKKEGVELPGRLRDVVADAMGTSSTALARKRVIRTQLTVPGFRQAWESGKMGETVAYELARLPEKAQYRALDLLIDAGVDYEKADIKTVQRIKRKVELGESPAQDLAVLAVKRGIKCPGGDFTPLLAALLREALPTSVQSMVRDAGTKAEGLQVLHDFGLTHYSTGGAPVNWNADPGGLTIRTPICRRLKWTEVWDLLALDTMQRASAWLPEKKKAAAETQRKDAAEAQRKDAGVASPAPTGKAELPRAAEGAGHYRWRSCLKDPPEEGALVFVSCTGNWADVCKYSGRKFLDDYGDPMEIDDRDFWLPAPAWPEKGEG